MVVSRHLIWNLPHPDVAIGEWARVTRPGGVVGIINGTFPVNKDLWGEPYRAAFEQLPMAGGTAPETIASLMEGNGLTPVWTEWLNALAEVKIRTLPDGPSYGPNQRYLVAGVKPG